MAGNSILRHSKIVYLLISTTILIFALSYYLPIGLDWHNAYQPAALEMLKGESPYKISKFGQAFYNAPWALIPFLPFALLPYKLGRAGVFIMGIAGFAITANKLKAPLLSMLIFFTSAAVIGCLNNGNLDWLPLLAFILPARWGLIFATLKPQVGMGIALYWLVDSYREGGLRLVLKVITPTAALSLISFWFYGAWFLQSFRLVGDPNNMSLFPYSVLPGIYLLYLSIKQKDSRFAFAASPLLSPYVTQFSYVALLAALLHKPRWLGAASVILWIPVIIRIIH